MPAAIRNVSAQPAAWDVRFAISPKRCAAPPLLFAWASPSAFLRFGAGIQASRSVDRLDDLLLTCAERQSSKRETSSGRVHGGDAKKLGEYSAA